MIDNIFLTPVGPLQIFTWKGNLIMCDWESSQENRSDVRKRIQGHIECESDVISLVKLQLEEYFAGKRAAFDVPLITIGTPFQKLVWDALNTIPYGSTVSYSELAEKAGYPRSVRAVASACRSNALSIFIPCHRVIAATGKSGGYAGGIPAKQYLLKLENENRKKFLSSGRLESDIPD